MALTIVLLSFGPVGAEIATIVAVYIGWLGVLVAWLALDPQRQPGAEPPGARLPRAPLSPAMKHRVIVSAAAVVIVFAGLLSGFLSGISAPPSGSRTLLVAGSVTLLQQDMWLNYQDALVFRLPDGQYGYLARPDARWWLPWSSISLAPRWPNFARAAVFASSYSGLEFLGVQGSNVMFAYRDNLLHWHDPVPMQINGLPLTGVNISPGFMQYTSLASENPQFLALIPRPQGGLGLYARIEHPPWNWTGPLGVIGAGLGISAVTTAELGDGSLCVIVRAGSHLFEISHSPKGLPNSVGSGWSTPVEVRSGRGAITVSGSPQLVATTVSALGGTGMLIAVPVPGGAALLSTTGLDGSWDVEQLPIHSEVDALTVLPGSVNGRANIDITYRQGNNLFDIWRWNNGPWHGPSLVQWEN